MTKVVKLKQVKRPRTSMMQKICLQAYQEINKHPLNKGVIILPIDENGVVTDMFYSLPRTVIPTILPTTVYAYMSDVFHKEHF